VTTKPKIIDFHSHIIDREVTQICTRHSAITGFGRRPRPTRPDLDAKLLEPEVQLADMDRFGTDIAVLSCSTVHQSNTWADPAQQQDLVARSNETVARWVKFAPDRFIGAGELPLNDVSLALAELDRLAGLPGFRVISLPAQVAGLYLGDPAFHPIWQRIEALGLVAFVHPDGTRDPWFQNYSLWNSLGQSIEEAKFLASLIYEGVLDRCPLLQVVVAHGGGYFPHYPGRLDRNVAKPDTMRNIHGKPSDYLQRVWFDSCVYDSQTMAALVRRVGADRVVLGSDYPFGEEKDILGFVTRSVELRDAEAQAVAYGNAVNLLNLK
jgi:aminocarboxymuconate-semialdehyde decarboxylase